MEPDNFKPQVRAFPVVVVQPDSSELACGRKISLDKENQILEPRDIETGDAEPSSSSLEDIREDPSHSSRGESSSGAAVPAVENEEEVSYNPLTHYLTGQLLWSSLATYHHKCASHIAPVDQTPYQQGSLTVLMSLLFCICMSMTPMKQSGLRNALRILR